MNVVEEHRRDALSSVNVTETPEGLSAIGMSNCPAVIWQRASNSGLQAWIEALSPEQLPRMRGILRPETVRETVLRVCESAGTPDCTERLRLIDDISEQAEIFAHVMRAAWLRLRLDVVSTNACRKFHVDAVSARLICTYRGTGTQYGFASGHDNPERVFTVPTGSPIVLRGTLWRTEEETGFQHRSPPIEGTGETRLVLVLDPILDPEDEI